MKKILLILFVFLYQTAKSQLVYNASFTAPDTVCVNSPVALTNQSTNASTYYWSFCAADVNTAPIAANLGNIGNNLSLPVFTDIVSDNGNYYVFVVNHSPAGLVRLDFGNSLLNTPTSVNLGNFGNIIPNLSEGIQVVKNQNKWYALIVGGDPVLGQPYRIVKIEFGTNINNPSPTATNWGNIGGLDHPMELHLFQEGIDWYGFTVNSENSTITRFTFGISFDNIPTGINLGNIGNLDHPGGINVINDNNVWRAFTTNATSNTITRLDFGNSLSNIPTGVNLGNPNNALRDPRDLYILKYCDKTVAFIINGQPNAQLLKLDFNNDFSTIPSVINFGNLGNMNFPHSISKIFRVGDELYSFITNAGNNTITRLHFPKCSNSNIAGSALPNPPSVTYNIPGTYNISLTIDEGLPTQSSFCKQVVVLPKATADFSFLQNVCSPQDVQFKNESADYQSISWDFGNLAMSSEEEPLITFSEYGEYIIKLKATVDGGCADSIAKRIPVMLEKDSVISTRDTVLCLNQPFSLKTRDAFSYCWSASPDLSTTDIASPVISGIVPKTTYYVNALITGKNLIINGDFAQGNSGFVSAYRYSPGSGTSEGVYSVSSDVRAWHPSLSSCKDHSGANGNMLMVNGAGTTGVKVWSQKVSVQPNTTYSFLTWLQTLSLTSPAKLQFYINGNLIGDIFSASSNPCEWTRFYTLWNSGDTTSADIAIINQNTVTNGNDFALDDIFFGALKMVRDSVTVTINPNPEADFSYDIPLCKSVQLTGIGITEPAAITNWKWDFGDNRIASASTLTHNYLYGGKYTVKLMVTDKNACTDTVDKIIQLDTIKAEIGSDTIVCKNSPVRLRAAGGTKYEWSPTAFMTGANTADPEVRVEQTTRFYLKVKNGIECEDTASVLVAIKARPRFVKPPDRSMCADSTIQLKGNNGNAHRYLWSPSGTLDDMTAANPMAAPSGSTRYSVTITEMPCGYDTTFEVAVLVNPNPTVTVAKQRDIDCINPTTRLTAAGSGLNYEWSPATGVDNPAGSVVSASADSTTAFVVKNTNQYKCSAYDSVIVKVTKTDKPVFLLPNAFTPNKDGINDCFGIKHWGNVTIRDFSIFNRWGEKVFSTKNPRDCWDGMYKGKLQPAGNFVYIIRALSFCGEMVRKGSLVLIR